MTETHPPTEILTQSKEEPSDNFIDPESLNIYSENDLKIIAEAEVKIYKKKRSGTLYQVPTTQELSAAKIPDPEVFVKRLTILNEYLQGQAVKDRFGEDEEARDVWKTKIDREGTQEDKDSLKNAYGKNNQFRGNWIQAITGAMQLLASKYYQINKSHPHYLYLRNKGSEIFSQIDEMEQAAVEKKKNNIPYDNDAYNQRRLEIVQKINDSIQEIFQTILPPELLKGEKIDIT